MRRTVPSASARVVRERVVSENQTAAQAGPFGKLRADMTYVLQGWDWAAISGVGVAVGTGALAIATFRMAKGAGAAAISESESAALSARALNAQIKPILSDVPRGKYKGGLTPPAATLHGGRYQPRDPAGVCLNSFEAVIPLRNIGAGVCYIVYHALLLAPNADGARRVLLGEVEPQIVVTDEIARFHYLMEQASLDGLTLQVRYADSEGRQNETVEADIRQDEHYDWYLPELRYYRDRQKQPYVTSKRSGEPLLA